MDPYLLNSAGLSADDDAMLYSGIVPPGVKKRALAAQVRGSPLQIPSAGVDAPRPAQTMPAPSPPPGMTQPPDASASAQPAGPALPEGPLALRRAATEAAMRAADAAGQMPDTTAMQDAYRRRFEGAGPDIGLAMFLGSRGGRMGAQMGPAIFKQALEAREPMKTPYGTIDYSGFTADPFKAREFEVQRLERKATILEQQAMHAETAQERERAHRAAEQARADALEARKEQMRMHNATLAEARADRQQRLAQGRVQFTKDADGNPVAFDTVTRQFINVPSASGGAGAAPGGQQFPNQPSTKATEDERRIASNVKRIVSSAGLMTPEGMAPGAMEAIAGAVPKIGGALASGVRGASGTMGIGENTRQRTYQSQADVIDALLYISTGAAYNKEQLETMREAYMPAYTDSEDAKLAKQQRLLGMIEAAKARAGRAWTQDAENALQQILPTFGGAPAAPRGGPANPAPRSNFPRATGQGVSARARSFMD